MRKTRQHKPSCEDISRAHYQAERIRKLPEEPRWLSSPVAWAKFRARCRAIGRRHRAP